jgi:hypothetical protein
MSEERGNLLRRLHEEHDAQTAMLRELGAAAHRGDIAAMTSVFPRLEKATRDQLSLEGEELLPRYFETHAADAAKLRKQHARIRRRLNDLGLALELHALRSDMVDDFIDLLSRHYSWEDGLLNAWPERA